MKTFLLHTLGCKVNAYESEAVKEILLKNGYSEAKNGDNVDLVIVNTCAVTAMAEHKSRQKISSLHNKYSKAIIAVMGCSSQLHKDVIKDIDGVDILMGNNQHSHLLKNIEQYFETQKQIIDVDQNTRQREYQKLDITSFDDHIRANIKIADGCDNFCSYCIIPYIRGKFRSRDEAEILCEAQNLLKNGYKELILTGIDSASYGEDNHASFNGLLRKLVKLPGLERLSISSIEASQIDDDFISIFKENPVIARHLHIPLQSGSETVLKRMNRKYDKEDFLAKMEKLYQADNDVFLACDVICGFPGETDEEFTETEDFIKKCHFSFLHVFPYSVREGTLAAKMKNQVPASIKKERVRKLLSLSNELYQKYQDKMNGKMMHFLFESYDQKKKLYHGLSEYFLPLDIKSDKNIINQILCLEYQK